jgi:hypothetical protein
VYFTAEPGVRGCVLISCSPAAPAMEIPKAKRTRKFLIFTTNFVYCHRCLAIAFIQCEPMVHLSKMMCSQPRNPAEYNRDLIGRQHTHGRGVLLRAIPLSDAHL